MERTWSRCTALWLQSSAARAAEHHTSTGGAFSHPEPGQLGVRKRTRTHAYRARRWASAPSRTMMELSAFPQLMRLGRMCNYMRACTQCPAQKTTDAAGTAYMPPESAYAVHNPVKRCLSSNRCIAVQRRLHSFGLIVHGRYYGAADTACLGGTRRT